MTFRMATGLAVAFLAVASLAACSPGRNNTESAGEYVDDSGVTAKVKAALLSEPGVRSFEIGVETFKGTVQLSGFVGNEGAKQRAGQVAGAVPGVRAVRNSLVVK